jgi:hypothetical protein
VLLRGKGKFITQLLEFWALLTRAVCRYFFTYVLLRGKGKFITQLLEFWALLTRAVYADISSHMCFYGGNGSTQLYSIYCICHVSILQYCNYINAQRNLDSIWYLLLCKLVCGNAAASIRDQCGIFWGAYFCKFRARAVWMRIFNRVSISHQLRIGAGFSMVRG